MRCPVRQPLPEDIETSCGPDCLASPPSGKFVFARTLPGRWHTVTGDYLVEGYMYVDESDRGPMYRAAAGAQVRQGSLGPPWLVVHHRLDSVHIARWPGRLYRVGGRAPESAEQRAALARAAAGLLPTAGYTRVLAVDVLAELDPRTLFGPHGGAVADIIDVARTLDAQRAQHLADSTAPGTEEIYSRVWTRWLARQPGGSPYLDRDHEWTLAVPGAGPSGSPIGSGFSVIWDTVRRRAQQLATDAFIIDDEGDEVLAEPWSTAAATLLDAAMAYGAPDLMAASEQAVLTAAWRTVITGDSLD